MPQTKAKSKGGRTPEASPFSLRLLPVTKMLDPDAKHFKAGGFPTLHSSAFSCRSRWKCVPHPPVPIAGAVAAFEAHEGLSAETEKGDQVDSKRVT